MDEPGRRTLHPLLLQRSYWRGRLSELRSSGSSMLVLPRPDLSSAFAEVEEFRLKTHDGRRLWGLRARGRLPHDGPSARVCMVGPCEIPRIDRSAVEKGCVEYVFQVLPGRRLEDRVLDALRVCQIASANEGCDLREVDLSSADGRQPDEFLIASQIIAERHDEL